MAPLQAFEAAGLEPLLSAEVPWAVHLCLCPLLAALMAMPRLLELLPLAAVRRYLRQTHTRECGVFIDFCGLMQKDASGHRTPTEQALFKEGLGVMSSLYASLTCTAVLMDTSRGIAGLASAHPEATPHTPIPIRVGRS